MFKRLDNFVKIYKIINSNFDEEFKKELSKLNFVER